MKKIIAAASVLFVILSTNSCTKDRVPNPNSLNVAQTTLFNENFDETTIVAPNFPTGWYASGWKSDSSNFSANYTGASGVRNLVVSNDPVNTLTDTLYSKSFVTTGFNNIKVIYGVRRSTHFSDNGSSIVSFSYSIDGGVTWIPVSYTEATGDSNWYLVNAGVRIALQTNAANVASIRFRWVAHTNPTPSGTYRIDDFQLLGTAM